MRFAYIDSQGNEVSIPSVEALALRIELGAIGPHTQLYDASADRWGPAETHEIFHTLSRAKEEEEGFVAPPPPVTSAADEADGTGQSAAGEEETGEGHASPRPDRSEGPGSAPTAAEGDKGGTEADGGAEPEPEPEEEVEVSLDFTLIDPTAPMMGIPDDQAADAENALDVTGGPEPAAAEEGTGEPEKPAAWDIAALEGLEPPREPDQEPVEEGGVPDHGMQLEEPLSGGVMDFSGAEERDLAGDLDLEPPMADFSLESPPAWMEQDGPSREEPGEDESDDEDKELVIDLSRPADRAGRAARSPAGRGPAGGGGVVRPQWERTEPRSRPSPPRRPKRFPVGAVLGIVAIAAVGVAGWYGWSAFQSRREVARRVARDTSALPPVTIPEIPAELLPRMRDLGQAALAGTIAQFRADVVAIGLPKEPRDAWLGGAYLSNASQYPDIQRYWVLIDSLVDQVRHTDTKVFHEQYVKQLDSAGIKGDTARMLLARADSGFLATRAARFEAYNQMDDLTNAALDLHQFLLDHEADITYAPAAAGVSEDPVLEAVPRTKALGDQMWAMVDRITGALNELGTLDKVTTERLTAVLFDKIRRAGFQ